MLFGVWFIVAFILSCYLPGSWWIRPFKRSALEHILLASVLGVVLWGVQGYVFGYLNLRWLTYGYVALFTLLNLKTLPTEWTRLATLWHRLRNLTRTDWLLLGMVLLGMAIQLIQVVGSGWQYSSGIAFFRVNAFDGVMHLSFMEAIIRQFPPMQPGAVGLPITNYHYWSDLVMAELSRIWGIPVSWSYFQLWPVVIATLTGLAVYLVVKNWGGSRSAAFWALFFIYFGSDAIYLLALPIQQRWGFDMSAIDNGATQFLNVPHSFAKLIFLTGLIPLTQWSHTLDRKWGALTVAMLAPIVGFKIYFGMFASFGFGLIAAWHLLRSWWKNARTTNLIQGLVKTLRTHAPTLGLLILYVVISLAIFLPPNKNAGGLFWSPLEWPKLFMGHQQLNIGEWWLRHQVYEAAHNLKGLLFLDSVAVAIGLICVYGTRLLGFIPNRKVYHQLPTSILIFFIPGILLFTFLGLFTLQTSGLFNVFNFFAVSCVPLALLTGLWINTLWCSKKLVLKLLASLIVLATLPRIAFHAYEATSQQLAFKYDKIVRPGELAALNYLRYETPPDSIVQAHPKNGWDASTPYVSYFSNRQTYLTGVGLMRTHNQPIDQRIEDLDIIIKSSNSMELSGKMKERKIDYLFLLKHSDQLFRFPIEENSLKTVFENDEAVIYQAI